VAVVTVFASSNVVVGFVWNLDTGIFENFEDMSIQVIEDAVQLVVWQDLCILHVLLVLGELLEDANSWRGL